MMLCLVNPKEDLSRILEVSKYNEMNLKQLIL